MYYPCSEYNGADQLCSYCEADLRLCFRIGKNPRCGSVKISKMQMKYTSSFTVKALNV